ncbi:MAG: diguanylate cyclase, partial [Magnetococcales bacterium]|nr:diguanylate cyclase [Magnetococcales bacterium]
MNVLAYEDKITPKVTRYALLGLLVWTLVVGGSLLFNILNQKNNTILLATQIARANFNKDQAYRFWASSHGGVYVKPNERTPPSPWMAHLPDRDVVTTDGVQLTLMNPAYMLRQMMEENGELYGIHGRIVGIVYLNPNNKADPWEEAAIRAFEKNVEEVSEITETKDGPTVRLIRPMIMREDCLKCHGHLGFKIGDVRGAVGINVPLAPYQAIENRLVHWMVMSHGGVWLLGSVAIAMVAGKSRRRLLEKEEANQEIQIAAKVFENMTEATVITNPEGVILRVNPGFTAVTGYQAAEVIGQRPSMIKSNHHNEEFYQQLWQSLRLYGQWQGEIWNRRKDGRIFAAWESIVSVRDEQGNVVQYIGSFYDITEKKLSEERIRHMAQFDFLTELPNRALFQDRLTHALHHASREDHKVALLFLDLDGFKKVNDTLGHAQGDLLLREIAIRLLGCVRASDTVARLGGDEFTIVMENLQGNGDVILVAEKVLKDVARPVHLQEREVYVSASIGIALYPDDGNTAAELLQFADAAMYQAKGEGKNRFHLFNKALKERAELRLNMEADLRRALKENSLEVYYQPKIEITTGRIASFEALVRWNHPQLGMVSPGLFIPLAEELGLVQKIDHFVLQQACQQLAQWRAEGFDLALAVNFSAPQHPYSRALLAAALD